MRKTVSESLTVYRKDDGEYVSIKEMFVGWWYVEYDDKSEWIAYRDRQSAEEDVEEAYGYS